MNNKGQTVIGVFFFIIVFIFLWIIFLAPYLNILGDTLVASSGETGLMAFVYMNLNLIVLIGVTLTILLGGAVATR